MAGFRDIIGHENIIAHMQEAIAAGKISHAYILNGPADSGKKMLAEAFAMALQCERVQALTGRAESPESRDEIPAASGGGERSSTQNRPLEKRQKVLPSQIDACGVCPSCHRALGHNQPDIIYVTHEKPKIISVREVREQLVDNVEIRPYSSRYKVYIVDEAEKMNVQAQNAILKTIEEPPSYAVILLLTENADSFLPTIRSRCVTLNLKAVSEEKIRAFLMEQYQLPDYQAQMFTAFSQGNVGMAKKLATSESFQELKDIVVSQLTKMPDIPVYELETRVAELDDLKEQTQEYLDLLWFWFRDVLLLKSGAESAGLIFAEQEMILRRQAGEITYAGLSGIFDEISHAQHRLQANVNRNLTLEMLLMKIQEAVRAA